MRLIDVAPRIGRAWDSYREDHLRAAVHAAHRFRLPNESLVDATRRIYVTAVEHDYRRARRTKP